MPARYCILIVDDEPALRATLQRYISLCGHHSMLAGSGPEALNLLQSGLTPDLVLLDTTMPGVDGLATLRQMKERYPGLAVVMLAPPEDTKQGHLSLNEGASDFISKPVDLQTLKRTLEIHLRR